MKSICKHIVLVGLFCMSMATRSAANDVQVKIPESSLQVVINKMIEARAFSFGSTSDKVGVNYYGYLPYQAVLDILPGNEFTLTLTGKAIANFQLGPFNFNLSGLNNQVIVIDGSINIQNQGSGYKLILIPDDFTDQTGNWLSGAINLASLLIKLPEISTSAELPFLADAATSFFTSATPTLTTTGNEVIFGYTLKAGPRFITAQNRVNDKTNIGHIQKVAGSTITTYDSPHVFEQNTGTSIQVQTPEELLDDAGEKHKYRWWMDQENTSQTEIATRRIQHQVDSDETLSAVFDPARRIQLSNSLEGSLSGGTVTYSGTTVSSYDDYDFFNASQQKTINSTVPSGTHNSNWRFWKWSDGNTSRQRNIIINQNYNLQAQWKGVGRSTDAGAFTNNSQRRMVQTTSGSMPGYEYWLYRVYTSMGHVWMEYSSDRGATWTLGNGGKPLDGGAGGKNPSIDYYHDDWDNMNYIGVVWQQPHNNTYKIQGMMFNQAADVVQDPQSQYATTIYTEPSDAYSVDANPNVVLTGGAHSFYVVSIERKSSSGNWDAGIHLLVGTISDIGTVWAGPFDLYEKHAKIAQTNASTTNVQMSLVPGTPNTLNLIRQQGTSGPIYSELIGVSRSSGGLITISQASDGVISYPSLSTKPSLVSFSDYYFSACWIEAYDMVYFNLISPSVLYYFGDFANSCSINRGGGAGTNGFVVWSQNPYSGRTNKSIRFTNGLPESSTITTLTTSGQYVQVGNGTTSNLSHMYVTAFYPFTAPYHFQTSSALGPASKAGQVEIAEGRGFFLRNGAASFSYRFSGLNVDGVHIPFVDVPEKYDYGNLEHLNNTLLTEPFQVHAASEIAFNERVGFADSSASAAKAMGRDGFIRYRLELIEEGTAKSAGTLREENFTSSTIRKSQSRTYAVNPAGLEGKVVRAKITVETNQVKTEKASALPDAFPEEVQRARLNKRRSTNLVLTRHYSEVNEARPKPDVEQLTVLQDTPDSYNLSQNYPNPFNPSTIIRYQLPSNENIRLEVFDLLGRKVSTLVNERQSAGHYSVTFDASHLASGFYIYRLRAGDFIQSKKLFLVK